jgi:hypothetical protein
MRTLKTPVAKNPRFSALLERLLKEVTQLYQTMLKDDGSLVSQDWMGDFADMMRLVFDPT